MGAALPDPVHQQFDDEISAGRVLVVVDADEDTRARLLPVMQDAGATALELKHA